MATTIASSSTSNNNNNNSNNNQKHKKRKHKIIVFFELTSLAQLFSKFLSLRLGHTIGVWELHGKMHQRERSVVSRRFRAASDGVLLTSDVSARGVDYPDVTCVVQVGAPRNRETYIHRVGRTGRAGKEGEAILVLPQLSDIDDHAKHCPVEVRDDLEGLDLVRDESLEKSLRSTSRRKNKNNSMNHRRILENELGILQHDLKNGTDTSGIADSLTLAYHSLVSYYFQTSRRRRTNHQQQEQREASAVAKFLNQIIVDFGLPEIPAIGFQRAKSMGIDHLAGQLNIRKDWEDQYQFHNWENVDGGGDDYGRRRNIPRHSNNNFDDWFGISPQSQHVSHPKKSTSKVEADRNKDKTRS